MEKVKMFFNIGKLRERNRETIRKKMRGETEKKAKKGKAERGTKKETLVDLS